MIAESIWNHIPIAVICVFAVPIVAIIADAWRKIERDRSENDLKRNMVERGMSAADIERVLNAGGSKESKDDTRVIGRDRA